MTPSGRDHSDLEPGPNPSRVIFTLRAARADLAVLGVSPCCRAMRLTSAGAGRYPPACLDLWRSGSRLLPQALAGAGFAPMQVCFPRAIRPCQSHSTLFG